MEIKELQKTWDAFGKTNALWSILTNAGKWDTDEFFRTGEKDIEAIMDHINGLNFKLPRGRALDFGCGAGRLTQALCKYFNEAAGVDIAPSMIDLANKYNRYKDKCKYYLNGSDDLKIFESNFFDFVFTIIVLQHMQPKYSKSYMKEFIRILAPGGMIIFQLPAELVTAENAALIGAVGATAPLPNSAFNARIRMINPPSSMKPGSQVILTAEVTNLGNVPWPAVGSGEKFKVKLGNHWLDAEGKTLINDDGRASLPHDLKPQETVAIPIPITSPRQEGTYILELDMVQEAVAWFKNKGSQTVSARIKNGNTALAGVAKRLNRIFTASNKSNGSTESDDFVPHMQMYGVPKQEVVEWVELNGGKIVDIQPDQSAGQDWISYRYSITK